MELHAGENRPCFPEIHVWCQMYCYGEGILTSGGYKRLNDAPMSMLGGA